MGKRKRSDSETGKKKKSKKRKLVNLDEDEPLEDSFTRELFRNSGEDGKDKNFLDLDLKPDHLNRAVWVTPDRRIYLETFSPHYKQAYDFLIAIAEPISRLRIMHEYKLTDYSLYAAVSVRLTGEKILEVLDRISKVHIPAEIREYIMSTTDSYGKVSLVLRQNRYFLEARNPKVLWELQKQDAIKNAMKINPEECDEATGFIKSRTLRVAVGVGATGASQEGEGVKDVQGLDPDDDEDSGFVPEEYYCFEVERKAIEDVKKCCIKCNLPALEEYDFANDNAADNPDIPIDLKPSTTLRPYQEKSLSKMFGNGRARSGVIVLPCGAGKTLVGVTAACTVKKRALVLTSNSVAVGQWRSQFLQWSTIEDKHIVCFTANTHKEELTDDTHIIITTYSMISHSGTRSEDAKAMLRTVNNKSWGMLILDEVHLFAADTFRTVIRTCAAHCKLGLTATLVREDDKIEDLNFLIGSKLYEANWLDLSRAGHIATVSCAEVWCEMTTEFFREWLAPHHPQNKKRQISIMNPNKFRACEFLIRYHESRNDKVIVFADDIFALRTYATLMKRAFIFGETALAERNAVLNDFKYRPDVKTIFLSKMADNAIDLPDANVLIQISSHFGSRRQEAQRLGRILRAKAKTKGEYNAYFYTLVSKYTEEMAYSQKRQRFLINQGYTYKIITEIPEMAEENLHFETKEDQLELLSKTITAGCDKEILLDQASSKKRVGNASSLSGGSGQVYSAINPKPAKSWLPSRRK